MRLTIEQMKAEHLDQVLEIEQSSFPTPWSRDSLAAELENGLAYYIVALAANNQVVGYGGMWLFLGEAQINNIAVKPDMRGRGVGKTLMVYLIARATLSGCGNMSLEVRPSNLAARHLYESLGFVESGYRKRYYIESGEDAIIMQREGCV